MEKQRVTKGPHANPGRVRTRHARVTRKSLAGVPPAREVHSYEALGHLEGNRF